MNSGARVSRSGGLVVVVGDDGLGVRVLQELCELGITVTAVCAREEAPFARAARDERVSLVIGDPEHEDTLREAGLEEASACGLLVDSDLANLHIALELQELAPRARVVLRLFNISCVAPVPRVPPLSKHCRRRESDAWPSSATRTPSTQRSSSGCASLSSSAT